MLNILFKITTSLYNELSRVEKVVYNEKIQKQTFIFRTANTTLWETTVIAVYPGTLATHAEAQLMLANPVAALWLVGVIFLLKDA